MSESKLSPSPLRIAVVGGGIAGLCTAVALLEAKRNGANIDIQVYEQSHKFGEIGAGVVFGPNAQRAFHLMGISDVLDATTATGSNGKESDIWFAFSVGQKGRSDSDKLMGTIESHNAAKGSVHRADFLDQLMDRIPAEITHLKHRCTHTTVHSAGITMHFSSEGASDAEADIVIGSDGIKSALRAHIYDQNGLNKKDQEARYSAWIAWRGMVPISKYYEIVGDGVQTKQMYLGADKHIVMFPVRDGQIINIVAFVHDPNHTKLGGHTEPWGEPRSKDELLEEFSTFTDRPLSILKAVENPSIWGIFELPEIKCIMGDRLVLIGDAAHAMTPHQGAGAGQAVEDALFLSKLLASPFVTDSSPVARPAKVQQAIETYVKARYERQWLVQKTSHETGLIYEFLGPDGDDTAKIMKTLSRRLHWIWEWDIEAELEKMLECIS